MFRLVRTLLLISTVMISSVGIMSPAPSPAVAAATTWYVATTGNDANSCSSPAQPCKTIQAAVDKAINGDTIKVASGTYTGGISSVISINKQVSLSGGWNPLFNSQNERTVIDGQGVIRGIEIGEAGKTRIEKLVVQNGYSVSGGGGIYNVGVLTLTAGIVTSNTAGHPCCFSNNGGGGIANNGSMWIENSAIVYNSVFVNFLGAGILNYRKLFITNSFIAFNKQGEGIYNFNSYSVTTINNSTVYKNESAGLLAHSGTITYGHTRLWCINRDERHSWPLAEGAKARIKSRDGYRAGRDGS